MKKALSFGAMDFSAVREFVFYSLMFQYQFYGMCVVWVSVEFSSLVRWALEVGVSLHKYDSKIFVLGRMGNVCRVIL